jgi:hypothetical protein
MSAPIVFVTVGLLLSQRLHAFEPDVTQEIVKLLAEVTLVWVLFADASRVEPHLYLLLGGRSPASASLDP